MLGFTQSINGLAEVVAEIRGIVIQVQAGSSDSVLPQEQGMTMYRIVLECLNNTVKHPGARQVRIFNFAGRTTDKYYHCG